MTAGEACELLVDAVADVASARAERDAARAWLRASLAALVSQNVEIDRLREALRRERQQYADLRELVLERELAA